MKLNWSQLLSAVILTALGLFSTGCDSDFYLTESETAAYAGLFAEESSANNFLSATLPGQTLDIQFDNATSPPTIRSTNLTELMRNRTVLGVVEGYNHQVQLDRLETELRTQVQRWIGNKLEVYRGVNNAGVRLARLTSIQINFRNLPSFTFHPERQSIAFSLIVDLHINGTVEVNSLDPITNVIFGVNGTYPLVVSFADLHLNGEARLGSAFADTSEISFTITPQPGSVSVTDSGSSSAPGVVKNGVRDFMRDQLSRPLNSTFKQRYAYFTITGLNLTPASGRLNYHYQQLPDSGRALIHIVARGADGKLYHLRKSEGGTSIINTVLPFPGLQTRIENEPALCLSGADQLEVAATTSAGDLVYAHWRDERWVNQATFVPPTSSSTSGYAGKPAIVASAPGQVEVIAVGRDGGLWHFRRLNGLWRAPVALPISNIQGVRTAPYRDPVAVWTGNKVAVAFVDSQNRLQAIAYDLESKFWGQATNISTQESISYAPAMAASGNGQVDVVYAGASGIPYHRVLEIPAARFISSGSTTGIVLVRNEVSIGGVVNASPVLVSAKYRQLDFIGRGTDNRLYHNHFASSELAGGFVDGRTIQAGWQGWGDLNGNFSGSLTWSDGQMVSLAGGATPSGKVATVAIVQPSLLDNNPQQFLFYNTYASERFGAQPWKTVHWRGYEQAGRQRFVGQPAVAVTDRNFVLAYIDNNLTAQSARLTESNVASFAGVDNGTQVNPSPAVDPVTVSSIAGGSDTVLAGPDGRLRVVRILYGGSNTTVLSAPAGVTFAAPPAAVTYGNGQLEVVGVAQSGALYHWRRQNGNWTNATQLNGQVLSQPILMHLGAGQLVTLAVGLDQRLYLWYFSNGSWASSRPITTGFLLNQILFGPMAASSWGEGSIDLALVEAQTGALFQGRLGAGTITNTTTMGMTQGRLFTRLGGVLIDTPLITAISETRANILSVGTDHAIYSSWSSPDPDKTIFPSTQAPPVVWVGFDYLGGEYVLLGGVARTGANELTAVGTDQSGRLLLSRYRGVRWMQYQPITGQNPLTQLSPPRFRPTVTTFLN
jgi:hypothetical protein